MRYLSAVNCIIIHGEADNDFGGMTPTVTARCPHTGIESPAIWGDGPASIKRALATLAGDCTCGCFHQETQPPKTPRLNNYLHGLPSTSQNCMDRQTSTPD